MKYFQNVKSLRKRKLVSLYRMYLKLLSVFRRMRKQWVRNCLLTLHYFLTSIVNLFYLENYCLNHVIRQIPLVLCHEKTRFADGLINLINLVLKTVNLAYFPKQGSELFHSILVVVEKKILKTLILKDITIIQMTLNESFVYGN